MRKLTILAVALALTLQLTGAFCQIRVQVDLYTDCLYGQSECPQTVVHQCLAGSCAFLHVGVLNLPAGVDSTDDNLIDWPGGLTIRAGTYENGVWNEVPNLVPSLSLRRWTYRASRDRQRNAPGARDRAWIFQFTLPPQRTGHTLCFQAEYDVPGRGSFTSPLAAGSERMALTVVAPCSKADSDRVSGSFVRCANAEGDHERAMAIADSLIPLGWRDLAGLERATQSAWYTDNPVKQLYYLDLNYQAHGMTAEFERKLSREAAIWRYDKTRQEVIEKISQQQQQR